MKRGRILGVTPRGESAIFHLVPRGESHECQHGADCYCEPITMFRFYGKGGGTMLIVVHRHDAFECIIQTSPEERPSNGQ